LVLLAGVGLPLAAIRTQVVTAIDAVVHVARRGGVRRVETIAELGTATDPPTARMLFASHDGVLTAVGAPCRPARRPDVPDAPEGHTC
jgi:hypothetical protein